MSFLAERQSVLPCVQSFFEQENLTPNQIILAVYDYLTFFKEKIDEKDETFLTAKFLYDYLGQYQPLEENEIFYAFGIGVNPKTVFLSCPDDQKELKESAKKYLLLMKQEILSVPMLYDDLADLIVSVGGFKYTQDEIDRIAESQDEDEKQVLNFTNRRILNFIRVFSDSELKIEHNVKHRPECIFLATFINSVYNHGFISVKKRILRILKPRISQEFLKAIFIRELCNDLGLENAKVVNPETFAILRDDFRIGKKKKKSR